MFGRIAAGLVHDLSHPIQNIGNSCKLIVKMLDDPEYRETFRRTVEREMEIVKRVLEDLQNIAKPIPLERFPVEMNRSVAEAVESMQPHAETAGVTLQAELSPEAAFIEGDVFALGRVYRNLVLNAIQATAPGGLIVVATEGHGDRVAGAGLRHRLRHPGRPAGGGLRGFRHHQAARASASASRSRGRSSSSSADGSPSPAKSAKAPRSSSTFRAHAPGRCSSRAEAAMRCTLKEEGHVPEACESTEIEIDGHALRGALLRAEDRARRRRFSCEVTLDAGDRIILDDDSMTSLESKMARLAPATVYSRLLAGRPSVAA